MSDQPLISVIVPAFNATTTIGETIASAQAQTWGHIEILVVDDGSSDHTAELVETAASRDARVNLIRQPNQGPAVARNLAISRARGDFIAPLDADDTWRPEYLARQITALRSADPACGFAYALHRVVDEMGGHLRDFPDFGCEGRVFLQHLLVNFVGNGSSALFRRDAIVEAGGYDPRSRQWGGGEDYLLQLRIAERRPVAASHDYLVHYRRRRDSLSSNALKGYRAWASAFEAATAGVAYPPYIRRWAKADAAQAAAMRLLQAGHTGQALRLCGAALGSDPAAVTTDLGKRAFNLSRRVLAKAQRRAAGPPATVVETPQAAPAASGLLQRRLARLSELDRGFPDARPSMRREPVGQGHLAGEDGRKEIDEGQGGGPIRELKIVEEFAAGRRHRE